MALARKTDPETSHLAAASIEAALPALQAKVFALVAKHPGKTAQELARLAGESDPRRVNRRLSELHGAGRVIHGMAVKCKITGRKALTWFAGDLRA